MQDQHAVWETIATSFDATRCDVWAHVVRWLADQPPGRILDLMAGNGRHARAGRDVGHGMVAVDWSSGLCRAAARHAPTFLADATALPFRDDAFDGAVFVAGLHGLPTAGRSACLQELHRVLRPGAAAQITVWSREAPRFSAWGLPPGPVDVAVPWRRDGHDVQRHVHLATVDSLGRELAQAGLLVERLEAVQIASRDGPDNLVADVVA